MEGNPLGNLKIHHTREENEIRLRGIVASASFEDLILTKSEINMLRKLMNGEITQKEYEEYYGI